MAFNAVGNRLDDVIKAVASESFNWYSSSEAEYAGLAGEIAPPSRWTAQKTVGESI
jgi:hypothetical protein